MKPTVYARLVENLTKRVMRGGSPEPRPLERRVVADLRIKEFTAAVQGDTEMLQRLCLYDPLFCAILETGRMLAAEIEEP